MDGLWRDGSCLSLAEGGGGEVGAAQLLVVVFSFFLLLLSSLTVARGAAGGAPCPPASELGGDACNRQGDRRLASAAPCLPAEPMQMAHIKQS